jgi:hypothetical protein
MTQSFTPRRNLGSTGNSRRSKDRIAASALLVRNKILSDRFSLTFSVLLKMGGAVSVPVTAVIDGKQLGAYCKGNRDSTVFCSGPANVSSMVTYQCSSTATEDKYYCSLPSTGENYSCTIVEGANGTTNIKCRKSRTTGNNSFAATPAQGSGSPTGTITPPTITTPLSVNANQVNLNWTAISGLPSGTSLTGYTITRTAGSTTVTLPTNYPTSIITTTSYLDMFLTPNTTYQYTVNAILKPAPATPVSSAPVYVTTVAGPVLATPVLASNNKSATLTWTAPSGITSPVYTVWRSDQSQPLATNLSVLTYTDSTLAASKTYTYQVGATGTVANASGTSPASQTQTLISLPASVTTSNSSHVWLWVLLGVLLFFFLIALIGGLYIGMR